MPNLLTMAEPEPSSNTIAYRQSCTKSVDCSRLIKKCFKTIINNFIAFTGWLMPYAKESIMLKRVIQVLTAIIVINSEGRSQFLVLAMVIEI